MGHDDIWRRCKVCWLLFRLIGGCLARQNRHLRMLEEGNRSLHIPGSSVLNLGNIKLEIARASRVLRCSQLTCTASFFSSAKRLVAWTVLPLVGSHSPVSVASLSSPSCRCALVRLPGRAANQPRPVHQERRGHPREGWGGFGCVWARQPFGRFAAA